MHYTFTLHPDAVSVTPELKYILDVWAINKNFSYHFADAGITIGKSNDCHIRLSAAFVSRTLSSDQFNDKGMFSLEDGAPDYLGTAFFLASSGQEYEEKPLDALGRFTFKGSYQEKFRNATINVVQQCFDALTSAVRIASFERRTRFLLTHDIDTVYQAILQDGFHVLKKGRIDIFFRLLFRAAMGKPDWLNMDKIMGIESEYDCRSVFFWITKQGRADGLHNADYSFQASRIQKLLEAARQQGFENGLHKSIGGTFDEEMAAFHSPPTANRYHYLKFNLPSGYDAVEQAGLKLDASLGFAESPGFRNSYGLPVNPFHFKERRPYNFVEAPLHVMDTTLFKYQHASLDVAEKTVMDFFEQNRSNCVLSVLWHNNFFTNYKYKGYLPLYKKILSYIKENNLGTISTTDIIKEFSVVR